MSIISSSVSNTSLDIALYIFVYKGISLLNISFSFYYSIFYDADYICVV